MRKSIYVLGIAILTLFAASAATAQTAPYTRTVIVNKVGSSTANGAALLSALSSLSPAPDAGNRWVIKIEGGFYDVGSTPIVLPPHVNLEGSGIYTTIVRGSVQPFGSYLGGLVQPSSNVEIRDLTIQCLSNEQTPSCQAMSLESASPRLTDIRILSQGTGTGSHWGIRTFDSAPVLDRVKVLVDAAAGHDNYGIVYGGSSTLNLKRSSVAARNGGNNNVAIMLRENTNYSTMSETDVTASGGTVAAGIYYLYSTTSNVLLITNSDIVASAGSSKSFGIGDNLAGGSSPNIDIRYGRVYGTSHGIEHFGANVELINTEAFGNSVIVLGNIVKIGGSRLHGTGSTGAYSSAVCAGNYDENYAFFPSTCPP